MRPRGDVMERLAAADPRHDAERLRPREQVEADALLGRLLATPVQPAEQRPRARRCAPVATGALCSVAAAFAAVNLLDSDAPGPDVVARAVAAVSQGGAVYHVLERSRAGPLGGEGFERMTFYNEYWNTSGGRMHLKTFAPEGGHRGKLLSEVAGKRRPGRNGGPVLMWDSRSNTIVPAGLGFRPFIRGTPVIDRFSDPGTQLRTLEQQGRLRLAGTTRVGDREAYRLVSGRVPGKVKGAYARVEFLVDSETYLPLAQHQTVRHPSGHGWDSFTRYLVYERLPLNATTRQELDLDPHPGAKCSPSFEGTRRPDPVGFPNPCAR
jgi:hypothetical protein